MSWFNKSAVLWFALLGTGLASVLAAVPAMAEENVKRPYEVTEKRAPCDNYSAERQLFWGDTHVHTAFSIDAGVQRTRNTPDDAYAYARGKRVGLQPYTADGKPRRSAQISEPLDYVAITDHGEGLGMVGVCTTPGYEGYNSFFCRAYRNYPDFAFFAMIRMPTITRYLSKRNDFLYFLRRGSEPGAGLPGFCGENARDCTEAGVNRWMQIQEAAERAYDRSSACTFTSFIAYEWTGNSEVNLHRNVIFRNENVIPETLSYVQKFTPESLWEGLRELCLDAGSGCDVLSIPHNPNLSRGRMYPRPGQVSLLYTAEQARFRQRIEPLVEIMQHKGDSECFYAPGSADELCAFEKLPYALFASVFMPGLDSPPRQDDGYVRTVLLDGLRFQQLSGGNPYEIGITAATDTHLGTPGAVEEWQHQGHGGAGMAATTGLPKGLPDDIEYNPGGLGAVWAEENSRDSIFSALRRRETYGTSGPRIRVRFFAGWDYAAEMCDSRDFAAEGYRGGVPMGGVLRGAGGLTPSPRFAVKAVRATGTQSRPGAPLQRIQIIKGWLDADGQSHEQVYDVAGAATGASVNPLDCELRGSGYNQLCRVWQDPDFTPGQSAFYYARVVENPSCRWSHRICLQNRVNCREPETVREGLEGCCDERFPPTIQERAWTSPVWYYPGKQQQTTAIQK